MAKTKTANAAEDDKKPPVGFLLPLIHKLAPSVEDVESWVEKIRRQNPTASNLEIAAAIGDKMALLYAGQGALTALPGAVPGLGTAVQTAVEAGAISTDLTLLLRNQTYMTLAIAKVYGHNLRSPDRQYEVVLAMGLWCGAIKPIGEGVARVASKIAIAAFKKFPSKILQAINKKVGTTILTKYGTKRGGIAIGRAIPFFVGAAVGGTFNYFTMLGYKAVCISFYDDVLPNKRELNF